MDAREGAFDRLQSNAAEILDFVIDVPRPERDTIASCTTHDGGPDFHVCAIAEQTSLVKKHFFRGDE